MEDKRINIETGDMVGKTYFKVASWFNKDFLTDKERQEALKHVSLEIIQQILEDTFLQLNGVGKTGVDTVKNDTNTTRHTGKMFQINENAIINGLNRFKNQE